MFQIHGITIFDPDVPLLIPEVNGDHLQSRRQLKKYSGAIVTNPNCSTIGMVMALKPLFDNFGLESVNVVTMQALSGGVHFFGVSGPDSPTMLSRLSVVKKKSWRPSHLKYWGNLTVPGSISQISKSVHPQTGYLFLTDTPNPFR